MKGPWSGLKMCFALCVLAAAVSAQTPLGSAWTYQGRLEQSGVPTNGQLPMVFKLWDAASAGNQVGPTLTFDGQGGNPPPVAVNKGIFTVALDFGAGAFGPSARWLEITANGVTLSPRQRATSAPTANFSSAPWATGVGNLSYTGGNVGIGTAQPNTVLEVSRPSGDTELGLIGGDGGRRWTLQSSSGAADNLSGSFQIIDRTAGAARFFIDSTGKVGIGTTDPFSKLSVDGGADLTGDFAVGGLTQLWGGSILRGTVLATEHLGINTPLGPQARLHVTGDTRIDFGSLLVNSGSVQVNSGSVQINSGTLQFGSLTENSDPMYITRSNGTADYSQLVINIGDNPGAAGAPADDLTIKAGGQTIFFFRSNGDAAKIGAPIWANVSDARAKHDIEPLSGVLDQLLKLTGRTFFYNEPNVPGARPGKCIGFIAQDVEPVFPMWVSSDRNGMKTLQITGFEALTVEALRDLRAEKDREIAAVRAESEAGDTKLEALRQENAELRARLEAVERMLAELTSRPQADPHKPKNP